MEVQIKIIDVCMRYTGNVLSLAAFFFFASPMNEFPHHRVRKIKKKSARKKLHFLCFIWCLWCLEHLIPRGN